MVYLYSVQGETSQLHFKASAGNEERKDKKSTENISK